MQQIIAAKFDSIVHADAAAAALNEFIGTADICIFYNSPPGQHALFALGGDENTDPEARHAHAYAIATGTTMGVAAGAVGLFAGPIVGLAAAGIGAYTGSLFGAMGGMSEGKASEAVRRQPGVFVAVHMADPADKSRIIATLKKKHAKDIELAQGKWRQGDWVDFDPVAMPNLENQAAARHL
jgi:hypothetical protein